MVATHTTQHNTQQGRQAGERQQNSFLMTFWWRIVCNKRFYVQLLVECVAAGLTGPLKIVFILNYNVIAKLKRTKQISQLNQTFAFLSDWYVKHVNELEGMITRILCFQSIKTKIQNKKQNKHTHAHTSKKQGDKKQETRNKQELFTKNLQNLKLYPPKRAITAGNLDAKNHLNHQ